MEAGHEPRGREESNVKDGEKEEAINQENGGEISRKVEMDLLNMFIQFSSVVQSCPTLCDPVNHSTPGLPVQLQLLESTQIHAIESMMPSNHLILCRPLLLLPSILPSIRVFPNESALCIRWPKCWSFSFNIRPSSEYSELISFRMDWFDLLAVQGLSRVFSNTTVQKHQFFSAQLSL